MQESHPNHARSSERASRCIAVAMWQGHSTTKSAMCGSARPIAFCWCKAELTECHPSH